MSQLLSRSLFIIVMAIGGNGLSHSIGSSELKNQNKIDIHVGIYAPFSNQQAFIGRHLLGSAQTSSEQLKSSKINYTFYTLDQISNRRIAVRTLQNFINTHKINVILTRGAVNGLLVAPLAKKNNIVHFSMATDPTIADETNNYLLWSPVYEQAVAQINELKNRQKNQLADNKATKVMARKVISQLEESSPMTDVLQMLNKSAVLAINANPNCSTQDISNQIHALVASAGIKGPFNFAKNGVLYTKNQVKRLKNSQLRTA